MKVPTFHVIVAVAILAAQFAHATIQEKCRRQCRARLETCDASTPKKEKKKCRQAIVKDCRQHAKQVVASDRTEAIHMFCSGPLSSTTSTIASTTTSTIPSNSLLGTWDFYADDGTRSETFTVAAQVGDEIAGDFFEWGAWSGRVYEEGDWKGDVDVPTSDCPVNGFTFIVNPSDQPGRGYGSMRYRLVCTCAFCPVEDETWVGVFARR